MFVHYLIVFLSLLSLRFPSAVWFQILNSISQPLKLHYFEIPKQFHRQFASFLLSWPIHRDSGLLCCQPWWCRPIVRCLIVWSHGCRLRLLIHSVLAYGGFLPFLSNLLFRLSHAFWLLWPDSRFQYDG